MSKDPRSPPEQFRYLMNGTEAARAKGTGMSYVIIRTASDQNFPALYAVWQRPESGRGGSLLSQHATENDALEAKARYEAADARRAERA